MAQLGDIFSGIPPGATKKALTAIVQKTRRKRFVVPFVGRFAAAQAVLAAGVKPTQLVTSDISLFSSVLGYAASGQDVRALGMVLSKVCDLALERLAQIQNEKEGDGTT